MLEEITVDSFDHKKRLDIFLTSVSGESRSRIQKFIKQKGVLVNGKPIAVPHRFLEEGDVIQIPENYDIDKESPLNTKVDHGQFKRRPLKDSEILPLDVIFENDDVIVINKPAGVLVHPTESSEEPTIMDSAILHFPAIAEVGDRPEARAGIVHRLDRMVSGVMILAKTQDSFNDLKFKFQKRFVRKKYLTLVNGQLERDFDTLTFRIARSKKLGRMVARPESQEGKEATTMYETLRKFANATLLDVDLHTGRTHQIRVHMHAIGHPVVGDDLYGIAGQKTIRFPRLWLHSNELTIALPGESEARLFVAELPAELSKLTDSLHEI